MRRMNSRNGDELLTAARWPSLQEVRSISKDADDGDDDVIFNIRHNRYRLITVVHYVKTIEGNETKGQVHVRSFLTHKEYNHPATWDTTRVLANPAKMIAEGAPHVIHHDEELEAYTEALFKLTALPKPSPSEMEAIELLSLLVERHEDEH
jgi:mRNA interferase HigB